MTEPNGYGCTWNNNNNVDEIILATRINLIFHIGDDGGVGGGGGGEGGPTFSNFPDLPMLFFNGGGGGGGGVEGLFNSLTHAVFALADTCPPKWMNPDKVH